MENVELISKDIMALLVPSQLTGSHLRLLIVILGRGCGKVTVGKNFFEFVLKAGCRRRLQTLEPALRPCSDE